ncbi:MAG: Gfo/Idh/MocA family oxidoreductase [Candidatus Omnitrophica bacterium]|nr:Gfo/Idh/MocA family oxidoreductase [Candidatus Omnitrophota bacterium]
MRAPLRVAVIGVGHLGSRHAEVYARMPGVRLSAVCDIDPGRARAVARALRCRAVTDARRLRGAVDAASLAVPTSLHAAIGVPLLRQGVHLLIEKPIAATLAQADALIREAGRAGVVLQVGHIERFNAAIEAARRRLTHPRFIEIHRLSPYPFRGTDVSVVLDVMSHDLDLLLALVKRPPARIDAVGVSVLSPSEDIANARLSFAGGCVANLTASRISDESLSIDSKAQTVELARKRGAAIRRLHLPVNRRAPLQDELAAFIRSVRTGRPPEVSGAEGRSALALALRIEQAMRRSRLRPASRSLR